MFICYLKYSYDPVIASVAKQSLQPACISEVPKRLLRWEEHPPRNDGKRCILETLSKILGKVAPDAVDVGASVARVVVFH
jgi:hypothetical protein